MNINDSLMNYILNKNSVNKNEAKDKKENNSETNTLILNSANVYSFEIKNIYEQIECLSLRDSFIKNISFILNLPYIYYLDLFGNPIENYKPLIKIGTFGFLCISPPLNYFEKQILALKSLNIVILQAEIKDKGIYNNFLMRNPNILVLNNTIIDFGKKIRTFYAMINFRYYIQNFLLEKDDFPMTNNDNNNDNTNINSNMNGNNNKSARKSITSDALYNRDIFLEKRLKTKKKKAKNPKCLEIIKFYDEYNRNLFEIFKNNKNNFNQDILCVEEKKKFLIIYNTFNYIGQFFSKNNNYYKLNSKKNKNNNTDEDNDNDNLSLNYPNINIEMFTYLNLLQYKEFVLSIIILYLFSILSKGITNYLILLIFKKTDYYNSSYKNKNLVENDLKHLLDIDKSFLFAFYFKIYDILFEAKGKNIDLNKLYDIQDRLKMIIIADKINEILSHQESFITNYKLNTDLSQKNKIITKDFIRFLFDIKIFHKIFNIIQFVNDFIIFNNLISKLGHDFPEDMQFFTEVQGLLLSNFDKSNEIKESMADKNYNKIQITNLINNKFFFQNQNFNRANNNNTLTLFNFRRKTFFPNKKRINMVENLKPFNELKKEREELIKQNYINKALKSFFTVINKNTKKENKENYTNSVNNNKINIKNLKLNNFIIKKHKYKRNSSNHYELENTNMKKIDLYKTYSYNNKNNKEENIINNRYKLGKIINNLSNINKFKILSSKVKEEKINLNNRNMFQQLKNKNLFNNDILSNHIKTLEINNKNDNLNCLNIREMVNKNKKNNKLFLSYDINNKKKFIKETNQYTITINKKEKKIKYSLRIFKKGKIFKNTNNDYNLEDVKMNLKELNSIGSNPFNIIGKKAF